MFGFNYPITCQFSIYGINAKKSKRNQQSHKRYTFKVLDPIGIYKSGHDDEYDSYIWPILKLLRNGAGINEITEYLYNLEKDIVGSFPENKEQIVLVSEKLVSLKRKFHFDELKKKL